MSKVLIVGATSAIAHQTGRLFAKDGSSLFLVGRTADKLETVASDLKVRGATSVGTLVLDANDLDRHQELLDKAIESLGGLDTVLIAHGTLGDQEKAEQDVEYALAEIKTNFLSAVSLSTLIGNYFKAQKSGVLAVISSVAGDRGRQTNYVYGSSKAATNAFLSGLRNRLYKSGVTVLTIEPGLVATPMTAHLKQGPLFASAEKVGGDIYQAIQKRKDVLYTPFFWRYIMLIIKNVPERVFKRLKL